MQFCLRDVRWYVRVNVYNMRRGLCCLLCILWLAYVYRLHCYLLGERHVVLCSSESSDIPKSSVFILFIFSKKTNKNYEQNNAGYQLLTTGGASS